MFVFRSKILSFFCLRCLLLLAVCGGWGLRAQAQQLPRYIFINTAPNMKWSVAKPSSFQRKTMEEIVKEVKAPKNEKMRLGISFIFDYLSTDLDSVAKSLDRFMQLSQQTGIPILINLDGINWMGARPDLWNWWDPTKPGYNPANRKNVEWTDWQESSAIKISWRNWGRQLRVLPAPNLASPAVVAAQIEAQQRLVPLIVKWYQALPARQKYLFGGLKVGHEASIGVNAYYYKNGNRYLEQKPNDEGLDPQESYRPEGGLSAGLAQLGYAAVKTAGIKSRGRITREDLAQVVSQYLTTLSRHAHELGVPKHLIYTHQGDNFDPWEKHLSFSAAANDYSLPGWSFYNTDPARAGDLGDVLDRRATPGWAAVEWYWPGANKTEWVYNLQRTLTYKNCRFLTIYNWENMLEKDPNGILAVREVIANWQEMD